jgi:hypothetical protein
VAASQCYSISVSFPRSAFAYTVSIPSLGNCSGNQFNVSKLYVNGACIRDRDNSVNPDCQGQNGTVASSNLTQSCSAVFSAGVSGTYSSLAGYSIGKRLYPQEQICTTASAGYFFIQTNCSSFNASRNFIQFNTTAYTLGSCLDTEIEYNHRVAVGVALGIIGFLLVLIAVFTIMYRRRYSRRNPYLPHQDINMQPYPTSSGPPMYNTGFPGQPPPYGQPNFHPAGPGGVVQGTPAYGAYTGGGFKPGPSS